MLNVPLFIKFIMRQWRSGELTLLFIALLIAVSCISAMHHFTAMVQKQLEQGAVNMLGADAMLTSNTPIDLGWIRRADLLGLKRTETLSFMSMVESNTHLQLSEIKAIASPYPLGGELSIAFQISDSLGKVQVQAPASGTVWLNPALLPLLSTDIGKPISIGAAVFKIAGVIREEPGQIGNWFTLSPRIIMNRVDVGKTQIIHPASVLTYSLLLNGSQAALNEMKDFVSPQLKGQQQWRDSRNNLLSVANAINRTVSYLNFGTLMSLVLAGVAISMAALRYCQRHLKQVALLRSFGATQAQIMQLYFSSIAGLGLMACFIGALIGYSLQPLLVQWLGGLLPQTNQKFEVGPFVLSVASGMLLLFCFSSGPLWQLRKVSAIALFRQHQLIWKNSPYITYGLAFFLLAIMAYHDTQSLKLTLIVLGVCLVFIAVVILGLWLCFSSLRHAKVRIPLNWRFGLNNISRNMQDSVLQVIGIGLALSSILSLMLLKNHLISDWKNKLPAKTPNFFVFNVQAEQIASLSKMLEHHGINVRHFYPVVRGRLTEINHESIYRLFGEEVKNINALQRELNLSWSDDLPDDNKISEGSWEVLDPQLAWVSVEKDLAARLKLKLGDVLSFAVNGDKVEVQISSIRQLDWSSFKPNFYMLLKPGIMNDFAKTMISSFYLPPDKKELLIQLTRSHRNVSLIDIANTINKVQSIVISAANAITFISFFALLSGVIIVILAILSLSTSKQQETYILKVLGMRRHALLWIRSSEAILLGLYAGFLAALTAIAFNVYLARVVFGSDFSIPWLLLILVPLGSALFSVLIHVIIQTMQYQGRASQ